MPDETMRAIAKETLRRLGFAPSDVLVQRVSLDVLRRMRQLGVVSVDEFADRLNAGHGVSWDQLAEAAAVNETALFREPRQFQALHNLLSTFANYPGPLRLLSAGCSTGEEAYSLAIIARRALAPLGKEFSVLGVDIDVNAIECAVKGEYRDIARFGELTDVGGGLVRGEDGVWKVHPTVRRTVRFSRFNLLSRPPAGGYQVIFCRNVLIYLTPENRDIVIDNLVDALTPGGALFVGASETLLDVPARLERATHGGTTYYRRRAPHLVR